MSSSRRGKAASLDAVVKAVSTGSRICLAKRARAIQRYDPDKTWTVTEDVP